MTDNFLRNYWAGRAGRAGVAAVLVVAAGLDQLGGQERPRLLPCWHSTGGSGRPQTSLTSTSPRPRSLLRPSRHMEEEEDKIDLGKTSPHHNLTYKSEQFLQHNHKAYSAINQYRVYFIQGCCSNILSCHIVLQVPSARVALSLSFPSRLRLQSSSSFCSSVSSPTAVLSLISSIVISRKVSSPLSLSRTSALWTSVGPA